VWQVADDDIIRKDGAIEHANGSIEIVPACNYQRYSLTGEAIDNTGQQQQQPGTGNWIEAEALYNSGTFGKIVANWTVPQFPQTYDGQTIYLFPDLEDFGGHRILQPVLEFLGSVWQIESWSYGLNGDNYHGQIYLTNPGDSIQGVVQSLCEAGNPGCNKWTVTTKDLNTGNTSVIPSSPTDGYSMNDADSGVLEAVVTSCTDYPPNGPTTFSNVAVLDDYFKPISNPVWAPLDTWIGKIPQCSYGTQWTATTATVDYGPQSQTTTPYESNVEVVPNGQINEYFVTLQDDTPGATIHYQVTICGIPYSWATTSPGSQIEFDVLCTCNPPSGQMYATAQGYIQSETTSMSF
jgi:hypothetical protein